MTYINKTKKSYGIACCRWNINKQKYEYLLVQKKYTYYFINFVFGHYNLNQKSQLKYLLNRISVQEKYLILSYDFGKMWYHIWGVDPEQTVNPKTIKIYNKYKQIFNKQVPLWRFNELKKLIYKSTSSNFLWELPKGRRDNGEQPLNCAIREFKEETGVDYNQYKILFSMGRKSYYNIDLNIKYIFEYYIAVYNSNTKIGKTLLYPRRKSINYCTEVCDIMWMSIDQIKDVNTKLAIFVESIQKQLKSYKIPQQTELKL